MPITYDSIATLTVTSASVNTLSFTSITSSFTDLVIVGKFKGAPTYATDHGARYNSDTGNNYGWNAFSIYETSTNSNPTVASGISATNNFAFYDFYGYVNDTAWGISTSYIYNYTSTNWPKMAVSISSSLNQATSYGQSYVTSVWNSTAAISSIAVSTTNATRYFATGTTFSIYGITRA